MGPSSGILALIGGFVGLAIIGQSIYKHTLDPIILIVGLLLIANGLWATWRKLRGHESSSKSARGPLSGKKKNR
ncbi:hypothetical protein K8I28_08360 [bacterium]|nr:hypothetical protein [bacterium]